MHDLLIIGGGINGAGIARDAAGRGLDVVLCEKDDLAGHTSSASTKLIHGGLRYLEHYDFALVRKALQEREVLLRAAPHIIWPMRFVLPVHKAMRPAWLIRLGLFLYDHLGGREILPGTRTLRRGKDDALGALKSGFVTAFEYSDCWVEDARLVVLNAVDAAERGASVLTRTECIRLERSETHWTATLRSDGETSTLEARAVINAAGPWVDDIVQQTGLGTNRSAVRLVKGSHILVPSLFDGEEAYFFQNDDGRIAFAIPYENNRFTMIGTTDEPFEGHRDRVEASDAEIRYLCDLANEYFERQIGPGDVAATFSGVRPLFDDRASDASAVTRDYVLTYDDAAGAPILSVYGGKITTYRKLAEDVLAQVLSALSSRAGVWTKHAPLPGGDIPGADFEAFASRQALTYAWIEATFLRRLLRTHGTLIHKVLAGATRMEDLGHHYGAGLYQKEVDHFVAYEFARSAGDILQRRTRLGLHMNPDEVAALDAYFTQCRAA